MKPTIIALVGPSGSGKTTLSLCLQNKVGIPAICSYTTRPIREGEENGREHWFVQECVSDISDTLAYTYFGGHHYWTMPEQVGNNRVCTYVIDEKGLMELKSKWQERYNIVSVYLDRKDLQGIAEDRRMRDNNRITLPSTEYDLILHNNKDLNSLYKSTMHFIAQFLM